MQHLAGRKSRPLWFTAGAAPLRGGMWLLHLIEATEEEELLRVLQVGGPAAC